MSAELEQLIADYLRVRRSLGFQLEYTEPLLGQFAAYLRSVGADTVTVEHALAFATAPAGASRRWQALRLSAIRCFTRWARTLDPAIEVPPARLLPARPTRSAPYIYSDNEIGALIDAARRLRPAIRAATMSTLVALMAATGIRTGEAIGLDLTDVDQQAATLTVTGKYGKTRTLPVHATVLTGLARYLEQRGQFRPAADCPALLVSIHGRRLPPSTAHQTFRRLCERAGLTSASSACRPRLHDLRHTFAVSTILDTYHRGDDPAVVLPILSTWLGHVRPGDTYWYLTGTAELLDAATVRFAEHYGHNESHPS